MMPISREQFLSAHRERKEQLAHADDVISSFRREFEQSPEEYQSGPEAERLLSALAVAERARDEMADFQRMGDWFAAHPELWE
jgi:hypothetical protein